MSAPHAGGTTVATDLFERHAVIDVDTHVTEPPDVFTARVASKWGDAVPHIARVDVTATAGYKDVWPEIPHGYEDIPPASHDVRARLALMDELGIHAEVL